MLEILKKIFGDKHTKDTKLLWPVVDEIKEEYEKIKDLTEDELKAKTVEFKEKIQKEGTLYLFKIRYKYSCLSCIIYLDLFWLMHFNIFYL